MGEYEKCRGRRGSYSPTQRLPQPTDTWRPLGDVIVDILTNVIVDILTNVIVRRHDVSQSHARILAEHLIDVER